MAALAAMPSASVALVVTRSAVLGFRNGLAVAVGIVLADLLFATLAVAGMTAVAHSAGAVFSVLRYVAGVYIIYMGISMMRSKSTGVTQTNDVRRSTLFASLASGFLLTLGDIKAILFYASLFPTLFDLRLFSRSDYILVVMITVLTVGGVKAVYAGLARSLVLSMSGNRLARHAKTIAGGLLTGAGIVVLAKS